MDKAASVSYRSMSGCVDTSSSSRYQVTMTTFHALLMPLKIYRAAPSPRLLRPDASERPKLSPQVHSNTNSQFSLRSEPPFPS
jgi:hypothetical protein